jgi:hypothetical protein
VLHILIIMSFQDIRTNHRHVIPDRSSSTPQHRPQEVHAAKGVRATTLPPPPPPPPPRCGSGIITGRDESFQPQKHRSLPVVQVADDPTTEPTPTTNDENVTPRQQLLLIRRRRQQQKRNRNYSLPNLITASSSTSENTNHGKDNRGNIENNNTKKSAYAALHHDIQSFGRMVVDLEAALQHAGQSPAASWHARILLRSTEETEALLLQRLHAHEAMGTPVTPSSPSKNKAVACRKLHRDLDRHHAALVEAMHRFECNQRVELSNALASTTYSHSEQDYFASKMHELERMNRNMHNVSNLYQDLAALVDAQQDTIDVLHSTVDEAAANAEAGAEQIHCATQRGMLCTVTSVDSHSDFLLNSGCGGGGGFIGGRGRPLGFDRSITVNLSDRGVEEAKEGDDDDDEGCHWQMLEQWHDDMAAVRNDIIYFGKDLIARGRKMATKATSPSSATAGGFVLRSP